MDISAQRSKIVSLLRSSSTLCGLLAVNPDDKTLPAIFLENRQPPPVYPCVTYKFSQLVPDQRFAPTNVEGGGESTKWENRLEIRCYDPAQVSRRDAIMAAVNLALDGTRNPLPVGTMFRIELLIALTDQWDSALNTFFHQMRYIVRFSSN